ncbi:MAG TPA: methyltransferase domain-containing protein [Bryobacteraceae bacterium]
MNRYDRQKRTRKSMPEADWTAGTIGSAEYEFAPLQGYRLGVIAGFDRETGHHPGCRLRRRQNREQVGCNRTQGKVYGVDHATESVAMAMRTNKQWIDTGRVEVREESVSRLPFSDGAFDVITAVETHFWWPALPTDLREVLRVLKPGGRLIVIAEVYKGAETFTSKAVERYSEKTGMALLSVEEHRGLLTDAGYSEVKVSTEPRKGWICCIGSKASVS